MNAPERSLSFLLDEDAGEVKCVYTPDTKVGLVALIYLRGWRVNRMASNHRLVQETHRFVFPTCISIGWIDGFD